MSKSRDGPSNQPHKARTAAGVESWWYENARSIDVFIARKGEDAIRCRIMCPDLEAALQRMRREAK